MQRTVTVTVDGVNLSNDELASIILDGFHTRNPDLDVTIQFADEPEPDAEPGAESTEPAERVPQPGKPGG